MSSNGRGKKYSITEQPVCAKYGWHAEGNLAIRPLTSVLRRRDTEPLRTRATSKSDAILKSERAALQQNAGTELYSEALNWIYHRHGERVRADIRSESGVTCRRYVLFSALAYWSPGSFNFRTSTTPVNRLAPEPSTTKVPLTEQPCPAEPPYSLQTRSTRLPTLLSGSK